MPPRFVLLAAALVVAIAEAPVSEVRATEARGDDGGCALTRPRSETPVSRDCAACHAALAHGGHVTDVRYPKWGATSGAASLRPLDEVQRRGLDLPNQEIHCVTCHDGASPWKYHLKLPRGATPTHAVDRLRPVTYENPRALPQPRPGDDIGRKPLCLACHMLD